MAAADEGAIWDCLQAGRSQLQEAAARYARPLSAADYWWLGAGLAAVTLAALAERSYAVGRLEQLVERMGHRGVKGDWLQRFVEELAELNAEGLLWPVYERRAEGPVEPTGLQVHPSFDARAGYFLALGHIAVAVAVHREDQAVVSALATAIFSMVESGLEPAHEALILGALQPAPEG